MAQDLIIEEESDHNSTQMTINQCISLSLSTAWRAGQDPGQRRIAQYFLPELGPPLSLSCENACVVSCEPDTTPGPPLALTLTYIRPVLRSHARQPQPATRTRTPGLASLSCSGCSRLAGDELRSQAREFGGIGWTGGIIVQIVTRSKIY